MILLYSKATAIITPPKTASTSLFETLCRPPYNGIFCIGPSPGDPSYYDHHSVILPSASFNWKKIVIVRHPLQRLVSLWGHMAKNQVMKFKPVTQLPAFVEAVSKNVYQFYFYQYNQCELLKNIEYDGIAKTENLSQDLIDLEILYDKKDLIQSNVFDPSNHAATPKYNDVLTSEMIEKLRWWWEPDAENFQYQV